MVARNYLGVQDPKAKFEALRPMDHALIEMMKSVKPWGAEYMILDAVRKTLATAAYHFTREPDFYAGKPH